MTSLSTSSLERRPLSLVMVIFFILARSFVHGRYVQDTISINIESDFDLGSSTRSWRNTFKVEFTEEIVILCHGSFSFEDLNENTGLVISIGCESLSLFGRYSGISWDQNSHDT